MSLWFALHPVHVTLTSIEYIPENDSFNVFVRMYADDFFRDFKLGGREIQEKGFSGENSDSREQMKSYLSEKVVLKVNNKRLSATLKNMEMADNEISMNLIYGISKRPKTITVTNLIMTGLYSDQSNMMIVKVNDFEEGVKLTSYVTEQTINIK